MNQVFYIACLGTEMNALKLTGRQLNRAKCAGNDKIRIDGRDDDMIFFRSSLGCTASNKETIRNNGPCANGLGTLNQVGYSTGEHFIWLYESCFDRANYSALYSKNEIAGQWIGGRFELPRSRTLSSRGVNFPLSNLKLSQAYKPDEQIKTFAKTLRRLVLAHIYVGEVFLSPVLLSASGDFIDASSQSATFYHFNAAPQWETIKSGNWR